MYEQQLLVQQKQVQRQIEADHELAMQLQEEVNKTSMNTFQIKAEKRNRSSTSPTQKCMDDRYICIK